MFVDFTTAERSALDAAIARAPAHLAPAFLSVRDHGCALVFVAQGCTPFVVPAERPAIVLVGDDLATSLGPRGFDRPCIRRHLKTCRAGAVIASEPVVAIYAEAVAWAVTRRENVVIVETRPAHEADWLNLIREVAPPDIALGLATVAPAGAPC